MSDIPSDTIQSLCDQLNKFYNDTSLLEQELNKLTLRIQYEDMINQCKINIRLWANKLVMRYNATQNRNIITHNLYIYITEIFNVLDQSKAFSCKECGTDIGLKDDIESKFIKLVKDNLKKKDIYLNAVNTILGATKQRILLVHIKYLGIMC